MRFLQLSPFLFSALFIFASCEKDNFDVIEEIDAPREPVVVVEQSTFLNYLLPSGENISTPGRGIITEEGLIALSTAEVGSIECIDGVISISNDTPGLVILMQREENDEISLGLVVGTNPTGIDQNSVQSGLVCETIPAILNISSFSEENIAGTITTELFYTTLSGPVGTDPCEGFVNLGVFEIEFNLPLTTCE